MYFSVLFLFYGLEKMMIIIIIVYMPRFLQKKPTHSESRKKTNETPMIFSTSIRLLSLQK